MYDKEVVTPRLTATSSPLTWTKELLMIKDLVEPIASIQFNSVLLNYYRDGNDSVAWHSDRENVLGKNPIIASVSLGQVRSFDIRNKADHSEKYSIKLEHGSLRSTALLP